MNSFWEIDKLEVSTFQRSLSYSITFTSFSQMSIYSNGRTTIIAFFDIIVGSETVITGNDFSPWWWKKFGQF